ncbi:3-hydroxyacyl-CoA dehydrogenase NAD-binding domain-containing protein [Hamadaea tsunoensis]|uniref:3-hydroxyacyl-CoA dehydrogenase NAD-binding domain-containing protein n=1 Tax=Hamadaea tsunoensis TaxID=53368 RepID=UPI00040A503D|nr:3-hydroxyacyl-CoA dehydrogenase NAD-binding domain-containing protein [Hamadaea tsunoensis]
MSGWIRNITVLGPGVRGSRIAGYAAGRGFPVIAYGLAAEAVPAGVRLSTDLAAATREAHLIIEAVPETVSAHRDAYASLAAVAPEGAIFATTSTLPPSDLVAFTARPDRFLALRLPDPARQADLARQDDQARQDGQAGQGGQGDIGEGAAEIMGTTATSPTVLRAVARFAADLGLVPVERRDGTTDGTTDATTDDGARSASIDSLRPR